LLANWCVSTAHASDEEERRKRETTVPPSPTREAAIKATETTVITNEILERLYGGAADAPDSGVQVVGTRERLLAEEQAGLESLERFRQRQARERTLESRISEARAEVAAAEAEVERLEKRALAVKNPYLARPVITEEEAEEWNRMDNAQRLRKTEEDIRQARERLEAAREELARLEGA
jgi:hypothetical protein